MLWEVVTYPLILLGLFRGSFLSFQSLEKDEKAKKEQLEYWVVLCALLFLFPKIDYILSFFLFSGLVGIIKFGLLFVVVAYKSKGYGFLYKLIEEPFIGNIEPYIEDWIKRSEGLRNKVCSTTVLLLASTQRSMNKILIKSTEDKHLYYLAKSVKKTLSDITKEQALREKRRSLSSDRGMFSKEPPSGWNTAAYTWTFDKVKQTQNERKHGGGTAYFNAEEDSNVTLHVHLKLKQAWDHFVNLCWSDTKSTAAGDENYTNKDYVRDKCREIKKEWAKGPRREQ